MLTAKAGRKLFSPLIECMERVAPGPISHPLVGPGWGWMPWNTVTRAGTVRLAGSPYTCRILYRLVYIGSVW